MEEYLLRRTPADKQPIPAELRDLQKSDCGAAVTLRLGGQVKAQVVRHDGSLPRSVIEAALTAMRSGKLPDRITSSVLSSLTVEVELLGAFSEVTADEIAGVFKPGLTGLVAGRDEKATYLLPSSSYERGLGAEAVRAEVLGRLGTLPKRWAIFTSRHFVSYPDGRVVELHRGKLARQTAKLDEKMLLEAAETVGGFLAVNQDPWTGRYRTATGEAADIVTNLRAAHAMSLLARHTGKKDFARSFNAAIAEINKTVSSGKSRAYVVTDRLTDRLPATAWLALTLAEQGDSQQARELLGRLTASLKAALGDGEAPQVDVLGEHRGYEPSLADKSLACVVLHRALPADDEFLTKRAPAVLQAIADGAVAGKLTAGGSLVEAAWAGRALAAAKFRQDPAGPFLAELRRSLRSRIAAPSQPPDEAGGLVDADGQVSTAATALCAAMLAEARGAGQLRSDQADSDAARLAETMLSFCRSIIYAPGEAFFAEDPSRWVGGVRSRPEAAGVTVEACAAAMEAFLAALPQPNP